MSHENFSKLYDIVRLVPMESDKLKKINKDELIEKLICAVETSRAAYEVINKQSDTILKMSSELVQQCAMNRSNVSSVVDMGGPSTSAMGGTSLPLPSYSSAVKLPPPIIIKSLNENTNIDINYLLNKANTALNKINVKTAKVNEQGTLIVQLPNETDHNIAIDNLKKVLPNSFNVERGKKLLPKLTVVGVPAEINENNIIKIICEKDDTINRLINEGEILDILKCWDIKNTSGEIESKKLVLKCSAVLRKYILDKNEGYIYISLSRCRVYDRLDVPMCYHCQGYYHFSMKCPKKNQNPVCGICANSHMTKNCNSSSEKCANCIRLIPGNENNHRTFSAVCPCLVKEKNLIKNRTDYSETKNE